MKFTKMTVPQLRAECKERGLPCYQHKGTRLRKADLISQLTKARRAERPSKHPGRSPQPVSAVDFDGVADYVLREMCLGLDRHADPAASRRAMIAALLASERSFGDLNAGRRADRAAHSAARGWVNPGRAIGVSIGGAGC